MDFESYEGGECYGLSNLRCLTLCDVKEDEDIMNNLKKILIFLTSILIVCLSVSYGSVVVNADDWLISGQYYYIKNVRSGKYLDVDHANTSDGTNILQWQFTGAENQKWHIIYLSGGDYKFVSALDSSKVLTIADATGNNGVNAILKTFDNSVKQKFGIMHYSNTTHQIRSGASGYNKCLTVENASCNNAANVFQYQYNETGNDQWLIEPATAYIPTYGINFANQNYDKDFSNTNNQHLLTYPDMSEFGGDCANFVSQCLAAGGIHYENNWYINKNNNTYLCPTTVAQLDDTWSLSDPSPWISAKQFYYYWKNRVTFESMKVSDILDNQSTNSNFQPGDVIQKVKQMPFNLYKPLHTMYIIHTPSSSLLSYI